MAYKYETKNCRNCEYCVKTDKGLYCSHRAGYPKVTSGGWCIDRKEKVKDDNHEYKCEECRHKDKCVRVSAFLMANVRPYSDGCENFKKGDAEND